MSRMFNSNPIDSATAMQAYIAKKCETLKFMKECRSSPEELEYAKSVNPLLPEPIRDQVEHLLMPEFDYLRFPEGILIVGAMVAKEVPDFPGSMRRDTICGWGCEALFNCVVTSLNNQRDSANINPGRHIEVNINSARHVQREFEKTIPINFPRNSHICFDMTMSRSPTGYVDFVLNDNFWSETLIWFLTDNRVLKEGGVIHFGNINPVREKIVQYRDLLEPLCDIYVEVAERMPVYLSRLLMKDQLEHFGDNVTLETQMSTLPTRYPFIAMRKKGSKAFDYDSFYSPACSTASCSSRSTTSSTSATGSSSSPIIVRNFPETEPFFIHYLSSATTSRKRAVTPHPTKKIARLRSISEVIDLTADDIDNDLSSPSQSDSDVKPRGRVDFNP